MKLIVTGSLILLIAAIVIITIIRRRVHIIEHMSTEQKIAQNYYTKAQVDEKIDKLEAYIGIISKNADKYFKAIAKDLYGND